MSETNYKEKIRNSHERCHYAGMEKDRRISKKILVGQELNQILAENQLLIKTAEPFMKQLNDFVKSSNFLTILTDSEGYILRVYGNDYILKETADLKMVPGASMSEECIGTNAMGIVLIEKEPMQLVANDHYIEAYHRWTCSCSPIRNPEGKIIGTLDLTGDTSFVHTHTLGMVVAAASALENMLGVISYQNKLLKSKRNIENVINSLPAGVISSDLFGNITYLNHFFEDLFGYDRNTVLNKKMWEFFEGWNTVIEIMQHKQVFLDEDVDVYAKKNIVQLNLSAYPVLGIDNELQEITFVFKDIKKVRKLAEKIMGRKAVYTFDKIISRNKNFNEIINFCKKIADSKSTILITGESGTGKEIIAQSIHNCSNRQNESFVAVNCGAIPRTLIESELFGYVEGAFTGSKRGGAAGKFEIADGGTIFLDEIGEMPLDMQTNLLRVIEEGYITRVGSSRPIPVNVRIIAASNKELKREVEKGNFRSDLFYRLNVLPVHLPPLRERSDDIPHLINYFMLTISKKLNKKPIKIPSEYLKKVMEYHWPGNIRELENFIELVINTEKLPMNLESKNYLEIEHSTCNDEYIPTLIELEKQHILLVLGKVNFNIVHAAKALGVSRNTLYRKMEDYKITPSEERK